MTDEKYGWKCIVERVEIGIVSGAQFRGAISARSNFGLGFALTHILTKSDESHRRKSIFDLAVADFDLAVADFDLAAAD